MKSTHHGDGRAVRITRVAVIIVLAAATLPTGAVWAAEVDGQQGEAQQAAPVWPEGAELIASDVTQTSVTLSWPEATDDTAVTGYHVYRDGTLIADLDGLPAPTNHTVTGLQPATTYTFTVEAHDASGNESDDGPSQTVTTLDEDPVGTACPSNDVPDAPFTDREEIRSVHRGNVDCAAWQEIVAGFPDNTYRPTAGVRRDQMASFIARTLNAAGITLPEPTDDRFADVPAGSTHDDAIHRLAAAGIVRGGAGGEDATSYGPAQQVRRDQMASFLLRAAEHATQRSLASETPTFPDVTSTNPHFANVNGASAAGLAAGFTDGTYRPGDGVRRDQMATFVIRLFTIDG